MTLLQETLNGVVGQPKQEGLLDMSKIENNHEIQPFSTPALDQLREMVAEKRPALDKLIKTHRNMSVAEYARELLIPVRVATIDRPEDVAEVAYSYAHRIYGET